MSRPEVSGPADADVRRADFAVVRRVSSRWADEDVYGHVNNVVYYSYVDTAVNAHLIEAGGTDVRRLDAVGIVAESSCRFLRELRFPLDVEVALSVERLGRSSVVYRVALFQGEHEAPAAVVRFVHVYVAVRAGDDADGPRRTLAVPEPVRRAVEPLLVG